MSCVRHEPDSGDRVVNVCVLVPSAAPELCLSLSWLPEHKYCRLGGLHSRNVFLEAGSLRWQCLRGQVLVRPLCLVYRPAFLHPILVGTECSGPVTPLYSLPSHRGGPTLMSSSKLSHLPEAPPPGSITLRVSASACELGWTGDAQTSHPLHAFYGAYLHCHSGGLFAFFSVVPLVSTILCDYLPRCIPSF